jgi:3-oxoacyl-[acyl-carrier protein] reductase
MGRLDDKVALVTGGGTGIGAAVARRFAAEGAYVVVTGRRVDPLGDVVHDIEATGGRAAAVGADVSDESEMEGAVTRLLERFGRLDIVLANAAVAPPPGPILDMTPADFRRILEIDLVGAWITAKVTAPALKASGGGHLVVVGSGGGHQVAPMVGAYSTAKAGLAMLVRVLAIELRPYRIAVNELIPGPVRTPGLAPMGDPDPGRRAAASRRRARTRRPAPAP